MNAGDRATFVSTQFGGFYTDGSSAFVHLLSSGLRGVALGEHFVPSADGSEVYVFDEQGRHLRTLDALAGAVRYSFTYTANGLLSTVSNVDGLVTTIERDSAGNATAIVAPNSQRTTLTMGPDGYLAQVTNPAGDPVSFTYGTGGLLATHTDLRGGNHVFTFDSDGLLTRDQGPAGTSWDLARTENGNSFTVTMTTAEGHQETHTVTDTPSGTNRVVTDGSGGSITQFRDPAGTTTFVNSDGTRTTTTESPDPRFGSAASYVASSSVRTPAGLVNSKTFARTVTMAGPQLVSALGSTTTNGRTTTIAYDAAIRTTTVTSPAGRIATLRRDDHGRPVFVQNGTLAPTTFTYDTLGRTVGVTLGTGGDARAFTASYDSLNRPIMFTDPSAVSSQMSYDPNNQLTSVARTGTAPIALGHNGAGDLTSVTPPGRSAYAFGHTAAGDGASFSVPAVGAENPTTGFEYDLDRRLTRVLGPDATQTTYSYEPGTGRLGSITYPREVGSATAGDIVATMGYSATTGRLEAMTVTDGPQVALQFDGELPLLTTWSGAVTGSVRRTYNNDFFVTGETVNTGYSTTFGYDADGLATQIGDLAMTRDAPNGLVTDTSIGSVTDHSTYTSFGEVRDYEVRYGGASIYHADYEARDALGRVEVKQETVQGETTTWMFGYDTLGRLTQVMKNGVLASTYVYDSNGNRILAPGLTSAPTYDAQDRLLGYGNWTFTYTAGGDLATMTDTTTGAVTRYHYDGIGSLRRAELPDGRVIDYVIDPAGRRVGKKINGVLLKGWLYVGDLSIVAELDGTGTVVSRIVGREYLVRGGVTYRLITDQVGSVRLVVDVATGAVAQRLDYDEFGKVLLDTSPGFQPFGFAGGLYDPDTGLVRFGARDYDAATGRWTSRDPVLFDGGDTNLFVYVGSDPINATDPTGLTRLFFDIDAGTLYVDPEDGEQMYEIKATSGDPDRRCMNNSFCKDKDAGPIPSGKWKIKPRSKEPYGVHEYRRSGEDWGSFRTRLIPSPALRREIVRMGRNPDTFYLHGGAWKGTEGCVDVGGGEYGNQTTFRLMRDLLLDPDNNVPLVAF